MSSLKKKTLSGIFWSLLQNILSQGISIITTIILARLLTPKDFGLIGMLSFFIGVSSAFIRGGFNQALVQKKDADEIDFSSVFFLNLVVSLFFYLLLFYSAPLIASFYKQELLVPMTRVLGLVIVIGAFSIVQDARLTKELQFKTLLTIQIPSIIISGSIAIIMAYKGFGVWSIVIQQVSNRFFYTIQLWFYSKWRPKRIIDKIRLKSMFRFGGNLMVSSLINRIYENLYPLIIGKFFTPQTLGYYQNAINLMIKPTSLIALAIKDVTFPSLSKIQDKELILKEAYKKAITQVLFWIMPLITLLAVLATPFFRFVLTDKWLPAVPYFRIIAISGILIPISTFNLDIVKVKGYGSLFLKINIAKKIITTIGIAISIPFGIWALIIFHPINTLIDYLINAYYSGRLINYSIRQQLGDLLGLFLYSICSGLAVLAFDTLLFQNFPDLIRLLTGGTLGIAIYICLNIIFKEETLQDAKNIFKYFAKERQRNVSAD